MCAAGAEVAGVAPDAPEELEPPDAPEELEPPDAPEELEPPDAPEELEPPDVPEELEPPDVAKYIIVIKTLRHAIPIAICFPVTGIYYY